MTLQVRDICRNVSIEKIYDAIDLLHLGNIEKIIYTVKPNVPFAEALVYFSKWNGIPEECSSMPEGEFISFMPDRIKPFVKDIEHSTQEYIPFTHIIDNNDEYWVAKNMINEITYKTISLKSKIKCQNTFLKIQKIPGKIDPDIITAMFAALGIINSVEFIWSRKMQTMEEILQDGIMCKVYLQFEDTQEMYKNLKYPEKL